jgi:hypothetical protein
MFKIHKTRISVVKYHPETPVEFSKKRFNRFSVVVTTYEILIFYLSYHYIYFHN